LEHLSGLWDQRSVWHSKDSHTSPTTAALTRSHSLCTSLSASCLQFMRFSIQPSKVGIDPGSVVGDSRCGSDIFPTSTSIFASIVCSSVCIGREGSSAVLNEGWDDCCGSSEAPVASAVGREQRKWESGKLEQVWSIKVFYAS
jgi:hypothetical protein